MTKENQKGFTLIEMIVVMSIIVIFPVVIILNLPKTNFRFSLSRSVHGFAQNVRQAQDLSLSSLTYSDDGGILRPVGGYGIYIDTDNLGQRQYIIYADAVPGNQRYDNFDYVVATVDISQSEEGVIIHRVGDILVNSASINFRSPGPEVFISQLGQKKDFIEIVFALESDLSKTQSVLIYSSGLIEVK